MKNFNIYDPMKKGQGMVLDGQSLAHLEVSCIVSVNRLLTIDRSCYSITKGRRTAPS